MNSNEASFPSPIPVSHPILRQFQTRCYFDISIGNRYAGRIVFGLYSDIARDSAGLILQPGDSWDGRYLKMFEDLLCLSLLMFFWIILGKCWANQAKQRLSDVTSTLHIWKFIEVA